MNQTNALKTLKDAYSSNSVMHITQVRLDRTKNLLMTGLRCDLIASKRLMLEACLATLRLVACASTASFEKSTPLN